MVRQQRRNGSKNDTGIDTAGIYGDQLLEAKISIDKIDGILVGYTQKFQLGPPPNFQT